VRNDEEEKEEKKNDFFCKNLLAHISGMAEDIFFKFEM